MYPDTAFLVASSMTLARRSLTQQWTPLRPEYTQSKCLKPKSSLSARSSTLIATVMNSQHLGQMAAFEQQVRISS